MPDEANPDLQLLIDLMDQIAAQQRDTDRARRDQRYRDQPDNARQQSGTQGPVADRQSSRQPAHRTERTDTHRDRHPPSTVDS
jgi:hypothetical protein